MPKGTFDKIPEEKKERLLRQAALIFAERGFSQTDMGELASRAKIAKGSIYNYFVSKEDLYLFVCRDALGRSRRTVYADLDRGWPVDQQLERIFKQGVAFAKSHPEYVALYLDVASSGKSHFANQLTLEVEKPTADRLKEIISQGVIRGEIRADIDVEVAALTINSMYIVTLASIASPHHQIRFREYLDMNHEEERIDIDAQVDRILTIIKGMLSPYDER